MLRFAALATRVSTLALTAAGLSSCASTTSAGGDRIADTVHVFSEGYLSGGTGVDTTAVRHASGRWTVVTRNGYPRRWTSSKRYVLSPARAAALEAVLDQPASYVDEPGPEEAAGCLDPWSIRIEWSWRSRKGLLQQQCGPWGAAERIDRLLVEAAP